MEAIKFASFNVNGINRPCKRCTIFDKIRSLNAHIALIQETHSAEPSAHIWETEWGGKCLFNHGLPGSRGVAILFSRSFSPRIIKQDQDEQGRILVVDLEVGDEIYTVASLYAPTQDKPAQQAGMDNLEALLDSMTADNIILGGDFNCILDPLLDRNSTTALPSSAAAHRGRIHTLMEERLLCNVMRVRNQNKRLYTFRRNNYASRLDFFLVSARLSEAASLLKTLEGLHSDHLLITFQLRFAPARRGQGFWRFDTSLLAEEDFLKAMRSFLTDWSPPQELSNPNTKWEWLKMQIGDFTRKYVKEKKSRDKLFLADLQAELEALYALVDRGIWIQPEHLESIKREITELDNKKANKAMLRARCKWARLGEKPSSYFLNLEKRVSKNKLLSTVLLEDGSTTSNPDLVLDHCKEFYQNLYYENAQNLTPVEEIENSVPDLDLPCLTDEESLLLDAPFTQEELKVALTKLNPNKCPGTDGLPPEFYTHFWDLLAPHLYQSLLFSVEEGALSSEQRRGIITLIPKKDVDRRLVSNWRPITLLNTDYKVLTKAAAIRLQRVMAKLIHPNQTGFMPGRFIGDNIRAVKDATQIFQVENRGGMVVSIDFSKAFDSVRWDFLFRTLEWFGFGPNFVDLIKMLFNNIESCVTNGGTSSGFFRPQRGIRQGCCISPFLFLLVVEVMAVMIRSSRDIQGIQLHMNTIKIVQFADDSTFLLKDESSLKTLIEIIKEFTGWSGLTLNKSKSSNLIPGRNESCSHQMESIPVVNRVKILGIWIFRDDSSQNNMAWNFGPLLNKIKSACETWGHRSLSLKGKVTVINSRLISLLQYPCASITTPPQVFSEYRKIVSNFIWNGRKAKIAYKTLILPIAKGGLNLMDLETRVQSNLLQWPKRFVSAPDSNSAITLAHFLHTTSIVDFLSYNLPGIPEGVKPMPFYSQMFKLWMQVHGTDPSNESEV